MEYDLITDEGTILSEITIEDFEEIIGGSIEGVFLKNENSHEKKMTTFVQTLHPAHSVKLEDLIFIKKLGKTEGF